MIWRTYWNCSIISNLFFLDVKLGHGVSSSDFYMHVKKTWVHVALSVLDILSLLMYDGTEVPRENLSLEVNLKLSLEKRAK